jgi:hypothetical protein
VQRNVTTFRGLETANENNHLTAWAPGWLTPCF